MMTTKWCSYGDHFPEVESFGLDKSTKTGLKSRCKPCEKEYLLNYRSQNKDSIRESRSRYYERNKVLSPRKVYSAEERRIAKNNNAKKTYYKNLESNRARNRSRMSARHRVISEALDSTYDLKYAWEVMCIYYGEMCMHPDCSKSDNLHMDHVIPLSIGGAHGFDNFQILCQFHNIQKGARSSADYRLVGIDAEYLNEIILKVKEGSVIPQ